jgi:hypothetical protein
MMSRGRQRIQQSDLTKAIKAARLAGMSVTEIRVDKDGAHIVTVDERGKTAPDKGVNEWDAL